MAGIGKEAWQDEHTECTNQPRHGEQCEEQSNASCRTSQVGHGQPEICQHKLGGDCAGWGDILVDIVLFIIMIIMIIIIIVNISIFTKRGKDVENLLEGRR